MSKLNIAAQLYTVRNFCKDEDGIKRTAEKVAKIGYKYVQVSALAEIPDENMRRIMDDNGLKIVATHFGFDRYQNDIEAMIDKHLVFGCPNAGIGSMPSGDFRASEQGYLDFAAKAEAVAETLLKHGIHFIYHNHAFEMHRFGNTTGLDLLYDNTKALCGEIDVHWIVAGGGDPVVWIEKLAGRMNVIHYKDFGVDIEGKRVFKEIGEGNLNWRAINEACEKAGVEYCIVEQDDCYGRDPFESLAVSYRNMKEMGLN